MKGLDLGIEKDRTKKRDRNRKSLKNTEYLTDSMRLLDYCGLFLSSEIFKLIGKLLLYCHFWI